MSVYKEGFAAINILKNEMVKLTEYSYGVGAPVDINDKIWNVAKQLVESYGIEGTRKETQLFGKTYKVSQLVRLVDEWAVADKRKTLEQATEKYKVTYNTGYCAGKQGYFTIERFF